MTLSFADGSTALLPAQGRRYRLEEAARADNFFYKLREGMDF